jgi:hypothetical protein
VPDGADGELLCWIPGAWFDRLAELSDEELRADLEHFQEIARARAQGKPFPRHPREKAIEE